MKAMLRSRPMHSWVLVLVAMLLVVGNLCEFVGEAEASAPIGAHEKNAPTDDHHHTSAHLASCQNGGVPATSPVLVFLEIITPPSVEVFLVPLHAPSVAIGRLPESLKGPPLFILHATLLI